MKKKIYLDYAATTPVDPKVQRAMIPYLTRRFGNTMSLHSLGQEAKVALEQSRSEIASMLGVRSPQIIFTSSATESNNLALKGVALARRSLGEGGHIIISSIEHECVLESAVWLEKQGFEITRLKVDKFGFIDLQELESAIRKDTILVSVIHANNETGVIQPIAQIGKICREKGVYLHSDASQSFGKIPIDVNKTQVDLLTASSHKIYGPKGAALLYVREGIKLEPFLHGGGHEEGLRSSTVNVPAIVGFAKAAKICKEDMKKELGRLSLLREKFIDGVLNKIPESKLNGSKDKCLPNIVNFTFKGVEGETLVIKLDLMGIFVSTGSACSLTTMEPSHVLLAMGLNPRDARSSIRFSLGRFMTEKDIDYVLRVLPEAVRELRTKRY
ncbi:MAG: cysteine desulfurase [Parcubacteria group bacterium Gr01-1014_30]|nr:MAG: cysteine desulfurase [Parcubacteria group bacterium Gr01-1014_30]